MMMVLSRLIFAVLLLVPSVGWGAACSSTIAQGSTESCDSITQNNITWTFSQNYTVGQYVNGDYWVVDSGSRVRINSISPSSSSSGTTRNGAMINPGVTTTQGYDELMPSTTYSDAANVALDVSSGSPLYLDANESLVSTVGYGTSAHYPQLSDAAVLTCVGSAPSSGAFRPPYVGSTKTSAYNESQINYGVLKNLTAPGSAPNIATLRTNHKKVWLDHISSHPGNRAHHPINNMPNQGDADNTGYGAEMVQNTSESLLYLHCNNTNSEKRELLIYLLQYAIDIEAIMSAGGSYSANGGQGLGRKSVLALGAKVFNSTSMLNILNYTNNKQFGTDQHVWYITSDDYSRTVCGYNRSQCGNSAIQYNITDHPIGMAEWGYAHNAYDSGWTSPPSWENDDGRVTGADYRDYYTRELGGLLSALMLGAKSAWGYNAPFDYMTRIIPLLDSTTVGNMEYYTPTTFERDMHTSYWNTYINYTGESTGGKMSGGGAISGGGYMR